MTILLDSPLVRYFAEFDEQHRDLWTNDYYELNKNNNPEKLFGIILADWQFRADNQDCVVCETYGELGTGKSLGTLDLAIRCGQIYGVPFEPKGILYDVFTVNMELRQKPRRSTTLVDEDVKAYGEMSRTVQDQLNEFRDQGRYTQKNVFWVSPHEREYSTGLTFEADRLRLQRKSNPICNKCPFYRECKANFFDTLCQKEDVRATLKINEPVAPYERTGYPLAFGFNVYYPHRFERKQVYRGHILIPMVDFETARAYDERKKRNIKRLQSFESPQAMIIEEVAKKIVAELSDKMIRQKEGVWKLEKLSRIEMYVLLSEHAAHLTIGVKKLALKEKVILLLEDIINEKNGETFNEDDEDGVEPSQCPGPDSGH